MKRVAIYPGTFNPITNGHVDIVKRALKLFDRLIIAVAKSSRKSPCIALEKRIDLVSRIFSNVSNVEVLELQGLAVDFAKAHKANFICRGLRATSDFDYEFQLSGMNQQLDCEIETIFFASSPSQATVSATIVREILALNGDVSKFVPQEVLTYFKREK